MARATGSVRGFTSGREKRWDVKRLRTTIYGLMNEGKATKWRDGFGRSRKSEYMSRTGLWNL